MPKEVGKAMQSMGGFAVEDRKVEDLLDPNRLQVEDRVHDSESQDRRLLLLLAS